MANSPQSVGNYELVRPLGAGGMAETFVAVRRGPASFAQQVCLKRILPSCVSDAVFVELFLDEARLLARLQNGNIVHVYDFGEADGTYYLAMELVDGYDLAKLLAILREHGRSLPLPVALYILSEILTALSYAHGLIVDGEPMGIVHRDISPSNILLSKTGEVKLTDFGIAKARGRAHRTQTGHIKGKIGYMSPEQIKGGELDGRSDLFSLGVVFFELLTGMHPFEGTTDFAVQLLIVSGKRAQLRELRPDIQESVVQLIDAMLETDPARRVANAAEALAMVPVMGSSFANQQALAQLMLSPATASAPGHIATEPLAYRAPGSAVNVDEVSRSQVDAKSALGSFAPSPVQYDRAPTASESSARPSLRRWLPVPLAVVALAVAGYGLWLRQRAHANDDNNRIGQEVPPLPSVGGAPPILPVVNKTPVEDVITPVNRAPRPLPTEPKVDHAVVEHVVSTPKANPPPAHRPTHEVVTPTKSDQPPPVEPMDHVISPGGTPGTRSAPVEDVISPSKGR